MFGFGDVIAQQLVEGRGKDHDVSHHAVSVFVHPPFRVCVHLVYTDCPARFLWGWVPGGRWSAHAAPNDPFTNFYDAQG